MMKGMKSAVLAAGILGLGAAAVSAAEGSQTATEFPQGYWEAQYGVPQTAVQYTVRLEVQDLAKAESAVERVLKAAGGTTTQNYFPGQNAGRTLNYHLPFDKAEKAAKQLLDIGQLKQFNSQRQVSATAGGEIDKKIDLLSKELEDNKAALSGMPIAQNVLSGMLRRLRQSKEAMAASASKAQIHVYLVLQGSREAQNY